MFVHLRLHTAYSLSQGAIKIPALIARLKEMNMHAACVTDSFNLFGALDFSQEAMKNQIQPILGAELTFALEAGQPPYTLPLLVKNKTGYESLLALMELWYVQNISPLSYAHLHTYHEGLICLTGGAEGPVVGLLNRESVAKAESCVRTLKSIFQDNLYMEIQRIHYQNVDLHEAQQLIFAQKYSIPIVATNPTYFHDKEDYEAHDVLLCIAQGVRQEYGKRRMSNLDFYLKSPEEMQVLFQDLPEAIENTQKIAERCGFSIFLREPILPQYPLLQNETEESALIRESRTYLTQYLKKNNFSEEEVSVYKDRLEIELDIINKMHFAGYFLIVADFIDWAKKQDIPVGPGRGSGAGSMVAFMMGITQLDPIKYGLLFERFLNPERVNLPDFDIDFCPERRDEVIQYVKSRYGEDCVSHIITFGTFQAKLILRDVARVKGIPYHVVDTLAKIIPFQPTNPFSLSDAENISEFNIYINQHNLQSLVHIAKKLEGLYRHAATHAAGIVISAKPLNKFMPMYFDPRNKLQATQFNMHGVEKMGLVKFDFLGLKTLSILDLTVKNIEKNYGETIELNHIDFQDSATYDMLSKGKTFGVFQLESAGIKKILLQMKPNKFSDIIALVALYRPGPMENIPEFLHRRAHPESTKYIHPLLKEVLKETYGIPIYQEQVMQMAQSLAGYSLGEADLLRRAMGKKIPSEMKKLKQNFIKRAIKNNGLTEKEVKNVADQIEAFAGYGFNKSHAAAYGLIAYQTAYLKTNYPLEYLSAFMFFDRERTARLDLFVNELKTWDVHVLPPDVNVSGLYFQKINEHTVSYAISAIKGTGDKVASFIENERKEKGIFVDINDFVTRCHAVLNKRTLESLIYAGALDLFEYSRATLTQNVKLLLQQGVKSTQQKSLFGKKLIHLIPTTETWDSKTLMNKEIEALGFSLTHDPLSEYASVLDAYTPIASMLSIERKGKRVKILAYCQRVRHIRDKGFYFLTLKDNSELMDGVVFQSVFQKNKTFIEEGIPAIYTLVSKIWGKDGRLIWRVDNISTIPHAKKITKKNKNIPKAISLKSTVIEISEPYVGQVMEVLQHDDFIKNTAQQVWLKVTMTNESITIDIGSVSLNEHMITWLKEVPNIVITSR